MKFKMLLMRTLCLGSMIACGLMAGVPAMAADADGVPTFKYDPEWPKQLPNNWTTGVIGAIYVDKDDHVWVATRPGSVNASVENYALDSLGDCCAPAPPVIEFDQAGNVVQAWGAIHAPEKRPPSTTAYPGPAKEVLIGKQVSGPYPDGLWPISEHGIYLDYKNNVWVSSQTNPSQVLKFSRDGKLIKQFGEGKEAASSADTKNFAGPTQFYVDAATNEVYISDGYRNRRIIVLDADTGAFKRMWGAYGKPPMDPQQKDPFGSDRSMENFSVTHCVMSTNEGLLYVCDRANSRIQVLKKDGTYVNEVVVGEGTRPAAKTHLGNVWSIGFSPDKDQKFMYVADGTNKKIWILNRKDLKVVGSFGSGGRQGGQFQTIHVLGVDSKGNIYAGETLSGNRIQRFLFTGMRPAN